MHATFWSENLKENISIPFLRNIHARTSEVVAT